MTNAIVYQGFRDDKRLNSTVLDHIHWDHIHFRPHSF